MPVIFTAPGKSYPPSEYWDGAWQETVPLLPVADDLVMVDDPAPAVSIPLRLARAGLKPDEAGVNTLVVHARMELEYMRLEAALRPRSSPSAIQRWVAYATAPPPQKGQKPMTLVGLATLGTRYALVLLPMEVDILHELGHTLGLPGHHYSQDDKTLPPDPVPLPYKGIGGFGYSEAYGGGLGSLALGSLTFESSSQAASPCRCA